MHITQMQNLRQNLTQDRLLLLIIEHLNLQFCVHPGAYLQFKIDASTTLAQRLTPSFNYVFNFQLLMQEILTEQLQL